MNRILVVEDEESLSYLICINLKMAGYETHPVYDGNDALALLQRGERYDLAILDIMVPGMNGFELLAPLNELNIPVIYLTAKNDLESKVRGLTGGAEDYIVKPFEVVELLIRIEKVLERHGANEKCIDISGLRINVEERSVKRDGRVIDMKPREFDLLVVLSRNRNVALSRERLLALVWGESYLGETRTVDVHIAQLRKKTGLTIVSIPKVGYRLEHE